MFPKGGSQEAETTFIPAAAAAPTFSAWTRGGAVASRSLRPGNPDPARRSNDRSRVPVWERAPSCSAPQSQHQRGDWRGEAEAPNSRGQRKGCLLFGARTCGVHRLPGRTGIRSRGPCRLIHKSTLLGEPPREGQPPPRPSWLYPAPRYAGVALETRVWPPYCSTALRAGSGSSKPGPTLDQG